MSRILFINRFYWPDETATAQLLVDLAEGLADRGHSVTVVTSCPEGSPAVEHRKGVAIHRAASRRSKRRGIASKARDFGSFLMKGTLLVRKLVQPGDCVVAMTDPPMVGAAVWLATRKRQVRLFHWIQDIYPEIVTALSRAPGLGALKPVRNRSWKAAEACVTVGSDMAGVVYESGVPPGRLFVVPNWPPAGLDLHIDSRAELRAAWGLTGKFVVGYSGNLGRVHDLETILGAAANLRDEPRVAFLFVGDGPRYRHLRVQAERLGLSNAFFRPAQPREHLAESLSVPQVHLVTLREGCEKYVFPSKLYGAAAVGRPVIFVGPPESEPARLVRDGGFGLTIAGGDSRGLAEAIQGLLSEPSNCKRMGEQAERFCAQNGSCASAISAWDELFRS